MNKTRSAYSRALGKRIPVEELPPTPEARARMERQRQKFLRTAGTETFARLPHDKTMKLYGKVGVAAMIILIHLDLLIFKSFGRNPVRLSNDKLATLGMSRSTKMRALRQLEAAGVIEAVQQGCESPLVTHLWHPLKP